MFALIFLLCFVNSFHYDFLLSGVDITSKNIFYPYKQNVLKNAKYDITKYNDSVQYVLINASISDSLTLFVEKYLLKKPTLNNHTVLFYNKLFSMFGMHYITNITINNTSSKIIHVEYEYLSHLFVRYSLWFYMNICHALGNYNRTNTYINLTLTLQQWLYEHHQYKNDGCNHHELSFKETKNLITFINNVLVKLIVEKYDEDYIDEQLDKLIKMHIDCKDEL